MGAMLEDDEEEDVGLDPAFGPISAAKGDLPGVGVGGEGGSGSGVTKGGEEEEEKNKWAVMKLPETVPVSEALQLEDAGEALDVFDVDGSGTIDHWLVAADFEGRAVAVREDGRPFMSAKDEVRLKWQNQKPGMDVSGARGPPCRPRSPRASTTRCSRRRCGTPTGCRRASRAR